MFVVKLMGGLGNQMFQYALGKNLSLKYDRPVNIDLSFLNNRHMGSDFVYREFDLDIFDEDFLFFKNDRIPVVLTEESSSFNNRVLNTDYSKYGCVLLEGYWQSPKYFEPNTDRVLKTFSFKNKIEALDCTKTLELFNHIKNTNSVMLNVRRTDYLNTDFHGVMGIDYFKKSVNIIKEKVNKPEFFVFSDDIEWCKQNFDSIEFNIVDHSFAGSKYQYYLQLMINCKHFIMPNSTFAWWSAWLCSNKEKIVIAPEKWFNKSASPDIVLQDWIKI